MLGYPGYPFRHCESCVLIACGIPSLSDTCFPRAVKVSTLLYLRANALLLRVIEVVCSMMSLSRIRLSIQAVDAVHGQRCRQAIHLGPGSDIWRSAGSRPRSRYISQRPHDGRNRKLPVFPPSTPSLPSRYDSGVHAEDRSREMQVGMAMTIFLSIVFPSLLSYIYIYIYIHSCLSGGEYSLGP